MKCKYSGPKTIVWFLCLVWLFTFETLCAIWHHMYCFKNVENTHGGALLSVKLQTLACKFTKSHTYPCVFPSYLNCAYDTKSRIASNLILKSHQISKSNSCTVVQELPVTKFIVRMQYSQLSRHQNSFKNLLQGHFIDSNTMTLALTISFSSLYLLPVYKIFTIFNIFKEFHAENQVDVI